LAELEMEDCSSREDGRNQCQLASGFAFERQKLYDKPCVEIIPTIGPMKAGGHETPF
jgi:hypothetical protein